MDDPQLRPQVLGERPRDRGLQGENRRGQLEGLVDLRGSTEVSVDVGAGERHEQRSRRALGAELPDGGVALARVQRHERVAVAAAPVLFDEQLVPELAQPVGPALRRDAIAAERVRRRGRDEGDLHEERRGQVRKPASTSRLSGV